MRREGVTRGAEVGGEKETARRGESKGGGREDARREKEKFARFYHSYETTTTTTSSLATRLVDYHPPTTRFAYGYAYTPRASAGATDQIFTDPSSEHVAMEFGSFGCHATQLTSSSCAPSTAPIWRHRAGSAGSGA